MKKILTYLVCFHLLTLFGGCKKDIMGYKGREGVYFDMRYGTIELLKNSWPHQPATNVDFVKLTGNTIDFAVKVTITGPIKSYDRSFHVEVNPDSTTAVLNQHYETLQEKWVIPAGAISTNVIVRLKRTPDLQETVKTLGLRLVPTADFSLSFPEWDAIPAFSSGVVVPKFDASLHTLRLNDLMVTPAVWSGSIQPGNRESGLFGVFSRKKMEFLSQYLGLKYEDFANTTTMPMARQLLIASDATAILIRLKDAGTPVLETDGRLMWMGSVPWTSIIGVPYIP